jgi:hypothetical protein
VRTTAAAELPLPLGRGKALQNLHMAVTLLSFPERIVRS